MRRDAIQQNKEPYLPHAAGPIYEFGDVTCLCSIEKILMSDTIVPYVASVSIHFV